MGRRRMILGAAVVAIIGLALAGPLREGPEPKVEIDALRGVVPGSRSVSGQMLLPNGRVGWGRSVHYQTDVPWVGVVDRIDAQLRRQSFSRRKTGAKSGAWSGPEATVGLLSHWTKERGMRMSDVWITRAATPGEIVRGWISERVGGLMPLRPGP